MNDLIKKFEDRRADLVKRSNESKDIVELKSINQQILTINDDIAALRSAQMANEKQDNSTTNDPNDPDGRTAAVNARLKELQAEQPPEFIQGKGFITSGENRNANFGSELEKREKAGQNLRDNVAVNSPLSTFGELRTVTVTPPSGESATIVVPSNFSANINPDFPVVSSLVDAVAHLSLNGGEKFRQPYITGIDTGGYTKEAENAKIAETHFDYVDIDKTKITAYAEVTEELEKLPSAPYADVVFQNIRTSMRAKLTAEILAGAGDTNHIVGIFSPNAIAIDANTDLGISEITDTTLDEIVFTYGGNEAVEDPAVLIISKPDLLAFSKVRTATKQKFYDIRLLGNSGSINGIPFIINSACKSLTATSGDFVAAVGDYCMAYGSLSNYLLVEFSPMEVKSSNDYRFPAGITSFRGSCFFGGQVVRKNGFLRIKKA